MNNKISVMISVLISTADYAKRGEQMIFGPDKEKVGLLFHFYLP